ncbi:hypothetical protein Gotri_008525 [Gossypium trilobum]|uniref:Uncharacterized protein n=2 Tax=Gossypium TaxID=3633 RepID=A0A7J9EJP2_9ROSI|nr:hypothetical protein [Gossypium trilobum]MBA0818670.1 hypothetical protein [Gossypium harknessii]
MRWGAIVRKEEGDFVQCIFGFMKSKVVVNILAAR